MEASFNMKIFAFIALCLITGGDAVANYDVRAYSSSRSLSKFFDT